MINKRKLFKFFIFIFLMIGMVLSIFVISSNKIKVYADEITTYEALKTALASANSNTTITVGNAIEIPNGETLDGNGATVRVPVPKINEDGTLNDSCSGWGVFFISDSSNVEICNMTIMGGCPEDDPEHWYEEYEKAAISAKGSSYLKLTNVTLTRSYRGLYTDYEAKVEMHNCNVVRNAAEYGGGIYSCGTLLMDGCSLSENRSLSSEGGGGALENQGLFIANNTVIVNNYSTECGGAINGVGNMYLINCTVTGNASETDKKGAGISVRRGTFYAVNSIFTDNYRKNGSTLFREDIAVQSAGTYNIKLINCIYSAINENGIDSNCLEKTNCYVDTECNTATSYRNSGVLNRTGGYTDSFNHPVAMTKTFGKPELYVPTNGSYDPVRRRGTKTYFAYEHFSSNEIGIGYLNGEENIETIYGEVYNLNDYEVTSYYESRGTRAEGVIGASGPIDGNLYTVTLTANSNGTVSGATIFGDSYSAGTSVTVTVTPNDASNHLYKWTLKDDNSNVVAVSSENPYTFTVTQNLTLSSEYTDATPIVVTASDQAIEYNAEAPSYTYTAKINDTTVTDEALLSQISTKLVPLTSAYTKGADVGNYIIEPASTNTTYMEVFTYSTTHYFISFVQGTLTVNKATPEVTAPTAKELTYTGEAQALVNAGSTTGGELQYKLNNGEYSTTVPTGTDAGAYTVYYKVVGGTNYNDVAEASVDVTIAKAEVTAPTANNTAYVYTGAEQTYTLTTNALYTISNNTRTNAGEQTVTVALNDKDNYCWSDSTTDNLEFTFTIGKATLTVTADNKAVTYGDAVPTYTVSYTGFVNEETVSVLTGTLAFACEYAQNSNVGSYTITPSGYTSDNYAISHVAGTLTVNKINATLTAPTAKELTYSGEAQALVNAGVPVGGTIQYKLDDGDYGTDIPTATNAGSYTVYYKVTGDANHNDTVEANLEVTIAKANSSLTAPTAKENLVYNAEAQALINAGTPVGGTIQYKLGNGEYSTSIPEGTNAGNYTVYYKVIGDANHNNIEEANVQVTIAKANASVTAPTAKELTYTGEARELVNAGIPAGGTIQYKLDDGDYGTDIPTAINAGNYTVYYKVVGDANHNDTVEANVQVTIARANSTLTAPTANVLTYTGSAQALVSAGIPVGGTIQYKLNDGDYGADIPTAINAGSYTVYYKVTGDANHNNIAEANVQVTIAKANASVTAPTAKELTYSGEAQALVNAGIPIGGTIQYKLNDGEYGADIPSATNAGNYTVYYKVIGDANHNDIVEAGVGVTIAKATPQISNLAANQNLVYNGSAQTLVTTGSTTGGTLKYSLDNETFNTSIPEGTNAQTYTVYYKVVGNDNFNDVAEASVQVTIAKADVTLTAPTAKELSYTGIAQALVNAGSTTGGELQYSLDNETFATSIPEGTNAQTYTVYYKVVGNDNFNDVAEASVQVTIAKADSTHTAPTAKELTYTGEAQALVNAGSTTGGTLQYKLGNGEYGVDIPTATDAGTYTVYYKVVGGTNYNNVAEASVDVTIAKAKVTAPTANNTAYVYTGAEQTYTLTTNALYTISNNTRTDAGEQTVTVALNDKDNYCWADSTTDNLEFTFTIGKATLTVTADDKAVTYNDAVPTYTVEYSGFVNNEDQSVLGGTLTYSCEYEVGSNAGSYTITPSGYTSDNYEISHVAGSLTVNKINPEVTAPTAKSGLVYTGSAQALINVGTTSGGTIQYKLENGEYSTTIPEGTNAGTHTIYYKVVGDINYNDVAEVSLEASIAKVDSTLTAPTANELTYSGEAQALVNAGVPVGGTIQYKLGTGEYGADIPTATNAGSYTVYYKVTGDSNHNDIAEASLEVSIAKADATLTAPTAKELTYSGEAQALVNAGTPIGGTIQYKLNDGNYGTDIPEGTNASTYTIYYKVVGDSNHNDVAEASLVVSIAKATPVVTAPQGLDNLVYTGEAQALISAGSTTGGTLKYSLDNETFNTSIPTGTNASTYTIYYKVVGDSNYCDIAESSLEIAIAKADPTITLPTIKEGLVYSGAKQELINAGSAVGGELQYSIDNRNYGTDIPKGLIAGTYTVYYKVLGDSNHNDISVSSITNTIEKKEIVIIWPDNDYTYNGSLQKVTASYKDISNKSIALSITIDNEFKNAGNYIATASFANNEKNYKLPTVVTNSYSIAKATPTYTVPTGLQAMINNKLSDVTLPEGFTWNDSTLSVGSEVTTKTFKAKFTPTDTNNYLVVENIDITITITADWNLDDQDVPDVSVKINGTDTVDATIKLKVEVKAEIDSEESSDTSIAEKEAVKEKLSKDDKIAIIYDVKLLRKTIINGVETVVEIQPSEIKEGVSIEIEMKLPEELIGSNFRILHIHNDETVEEVTYALSEDGKSISVTTNKLSEFAFIANEGSDGVNVGLIILIVILAILLCLTILLVLLFLLSGKWITRNGKAVKAMKIGKKDDKIKLLCMNFKVDYRNISEIYPSKAAALASIASSGEAETNNSEAKKEADLKEE